MCCQLNGLPPFARVSQNSIVCSSAAPAELAGHLEQQRITLAA